VAAGLPLGVPPVPGEMLNTSESTPVLFEVRRDNGNAWFLAHEQDGQPRLTLMPARQVITRFDQYDSFPLLAGLLASSGGTIRFAGVELKLVLFICGENNLLQSSKRTSVLKAPPSDEEHRSQLASALSGPWVVLNPAHNPYYPQALPKGFAKVGT